MSDPGYLAYKGFRVVDESETGINLLYLPFDTDCTVPHFTDAAKHPHIDQDGYVLYYTSQCPFNAKYVPILEKAATENRIPFQTIHIETKEQAQSAPTPCTTYALFHDGKFVGNEQLSDKKFLKLAMGSASC